MTLMKKTKKELVGMINSLEAENINLKDQLTRLEKKSVQKKSFWKRITGK